MTRLKATLSYDGTAFSGYQVQPDARTVQGEIERVLSKIHKGDKVKITASGRTDAGVHAKGQVIHFDTPLSIPVPNWKKALNTLLPEDIYVLNVEVVPESFHARFDIKEKEYRYFVDLSREPDLFRRQFVYHLPGILNIEMMEHAAKYIIGTHDFTSFCAANTDVQDKVRTITHLSIEQTGGTLCFKIIGNGFLYQMVRIIVGTLLEVGKGKVPPEAIHGIIGQRDRKAAFKTAPAKGLFLWRAGY